MRNRWVRATIAVITATMLAAVTGCTADRQEGRPTRLVLADNFSTKHPFGQGVQALRKILEERGPAVGVDLDYYGPGQLGTQSQMLTLIRTGAVDMGVVIPSYLSDELRLTGVGDLPVMSSEPCRTTEALRQMLEPGGTLSELEFKDRNLQALWGVTLGGIDIYTTEKRVVTPSDVQGLMLRTPGGVGDRVVQGIGAAPVAIPANDLYEALARKTVDGTLLPHYAVLSYSVDEVARYGTMGAELGATTAWFSINRDVWQGLDDEQRSLITEAAQTAQATSCAAVKKADEAAVDQMREAGIELTDLTPDVAAQWAATHKEITKKWVDDLESVGLDASRVSDELERRLTEGGNE